MITIFVASPNRSAEAERLAETLRREVLQSLADFSRADNYSVTVSVQNGP